MTLKSKVARGLKWQMLELLVRQGVSTVVFALLARLIEPASFGLFALIAAYLMFAGMFANQGFGSALIQHPKLTPEHCDSVYWFNVGCSLVLCLATLAAAGPIAAAMGDPRIAPLLRWSSLTLPINASCSIHNTLFVKALDFRRPALRTMVANTLSGLVGLGLAFSGAEVGALVGQQLASALASSIFLWTASPYRPKLRFSWRHFRELQAVGLPTFGMNFLWVFANRIDQVVIGKFGGPATLGLYTVANKLPEIVKMVVQQPVSQVSVPSLSAIQHDHARMREAIYQGLRIHAALSFSIYVGLASVTPELVPLFFGAKWAAAATLCSLLSLSALVITLQVFVHPALLATGGAGRSLVIGIFHAAGVAAVSMLAIPHGIEALAAGLILNNLVAAVAGLFVLRERIGLSPMRFLGRCAGPALAAAAMAFAVYLLHQALPVNWSAAARLATKVIVGAAVYLAVLAVVAHSTYGDVRKLATAALTRGPTKVNRPDPAT